MGLGINTNMSAMRTHGHLLQTDSSLQTSIEKLSSGYRINRAADKPAGLIISEQLRAQISGLTQAVENAQRASNIIGTAEGALSEMNSLLKSMRSLAVEAANSGVMDSDQVQANQDEMDSAIASIDRIANTTRFAGKSLLNGQQAYDVTSQSNEINDLTIRGAQFGAASNITVQVNVTAEAYQASSGGTLADASTNSVVRISGSKGSEVFSFASGLTLTQVADSINALTANTGVFASVGAASLHTTDFGEEAFLQIEKLSGTFSLSDIGNEGVDIEASVAGKSTATSGNYINVSSTFFSGTIEMSAGTGAGAYTFDMDESGMEFQLGANGTPGEQASLGISNMHSSALGRSQVSMQDTSSGYLSSIMSGDEHDLSTDPETAIKIIDYAISDINRTRASLGAFQKNSIETTINSLRVTNENLVDAESRIRDVDFAAELINMTRNQILMQAGTSMMAQANSTNESILQMLG